MGILNQLEGIQPGTTALDLAPMSSLNDGKTALTEKAVRADIQTFLRNNVQIFRDPLPVLTLEAICQETPYPITRNQAQSELAKADMQVLTIPAMERIGITFDMHGETIRIYKNGVLEYELPLSLKGGPNYSTLRNIDSIHGRMLLALYDEYPDDNRLQVQQHDMLPLIVHHLISVQTLVMGKPPHPTDEEIEQHRTDDEIQERVSTARDSIRNIGVIPSKEILTAYRERPIVHDVSQATLDNLATAHAVVEWLHNFLYTAPDEAMLRLADDPYKQARIDRASFYDDLGTILRDGIHYQHQMTIDLLVYHCYVNGINLETMADVINMIKEPELLKTLYQLTPTANGVLTDLFPDFAIPPGFLIPGQVPIISQRGREYLHRKREDHNKTISTLKPNDGDGKPMEHMHQERCPAIYHNAKIKPITSVPPQAGESTERYIKLWQSLAARNSDTCSFQPTDEGYLLTARQSPIAYYHRLLIDALGTSVK